MKILVFGAGAVGSLLGGLLARMAHDVDLLGRKEHLEVIEKKGLKISGIWGQHFIKTFELYAQVSEIPPDRNFDLILLTVKSFDTLEAVRQLKPLMKPQTTLLSFQNGLDNIETILKVIPSEQVLIGRIITGVEMVPGEVKVTVSADDMLIGAPTEVKPTMSPHEAARIFRLARIPSRAAENIVSEIWSKVIYNCALNGLCSVLEIPYGRITEDDKNRHALQHIVRECYAVAQKKGIYLNPDTPDAYYEYLLKVLIPKTADHYPSMLRDIQRKKRTEIDALNGAICGMGKEWGLKTPENERIMNLIRRQSEGYL
jgi:2-dehydropantoate 2-reductase